MTIDHIFKRTGSIYSYSDVSQYNDKIGNFHTIFSVKCINCSFSFWVDETNKPIDGHDFISCDEYIIKNIIE